MKRRARRNWRVTPPRPHRTLVLTTEESAFAHAHDWAQRSKRMVGVARMEPFNNWNVHPDGNVTIPFYNDRLDEAREIARRYDLRIVLARSLARSEGRR